MATKRIPVLKCPCTSEIIRFVRGALAWSLLALSCLTTRADTVITTCAESELRQAVAAGGKVTFNCSGTIVLRSPIAVTGEVVLDGSGNHVEISGNQTNRVFEVESNGILTLNQLSVVDGRSTEGAGFYNQGSLILLNCSIARHIALGANWEDVAFPAAGSGRGGAVYSTGSLVISNCTFMDNRAEGGQGGFSSPDPWMGRGAGGAGFGGGIYSETVNRGIIVSHSRFFRNVAYGGPGDVWPEWWTPGATYTAGGDAAGGGIYVQGGTLTLSHCEFTNNSALDSGFAEEYGNWAGGGNADGGAVCLRQGSVTAERTLFLENVVKAHQHPGRGGAIYNGGLLTATNCLFSWNSAHGSPAGHNKSASAGFGGAICSESSCFLLGNTFATNRATGGDGWASDEGGSVTPGGIGVGGGMMNQGIVFMLNNTFVGNEASGGAAGVAKLDWSGSFWSIGDGTNGYGGALCNLSNAFTTNCTFAWNKALGGLGSKPPKLETPRGKDGKGLGGGFATLSGTTWIMNSIMADNITGSNFYGSVLDGGHNLSSDSSALLSQTSSMTNTPALFDSYGDHGGPTPTLTLMSGSPAIDKGDPVPGLLVDQRGFPRSAGKTSDLGACEIQPAEGLRLFSTRLVLPNSFQFGFQSVEGVRYIIEHTDELLMNEGWSTLEEKVGSGGVEWIVDDAGGRSAHFYRVRVAAP